MLITAALTILLSLVTVKTSGAPITIQDCRFVQSASFTRGVRVVYKNTSKIPIKLVIFSVMQRSHETVVIDEGTFKPGEVVDHVLTSAPLTLWMGESTDRCAVVHVHFADGTTWGR